MDYKGDSQGKLVVQAIPCTSAGVKLSEDDFVEDPSELLGKPYSFKVFGKIPGSISSDC